MLSLMSPIGRGKHAMRVLWEIVGVWLGIDAVFVLVMWFRPTARGRLRLPHPLPRANVSGVWKRWKARKLWNM